MQYNLQSWFIEAANCIATVTPRQGFNVLPLTRGGFYESLLLPYFKWPKHPCTTREALNKLPVLCFCTRDDFECDILLIFFKGHSLKRRESRPFSETDFLLPWHHTWHFRKATRAGSLLTSVTHCSCANHFKEMSLS